MNQQKTKQSNLSDLNALTMQEMTRQKGHLPQF